MKRLTVSTSPPMTRRLPIARPATILHTERLAAHLRSGFIEANDLRRDIVMGEALDDEHIEKLRSAHDLAQSIERSTRKSLQLLARRRSDATGIEHDFIRPLGAVPMSPAEEMTRQAFADARTPRVSEVL